MEQIEVVITGYSIIVAMCVARLLDGVRPAAAKDRRYWVHLTWIFNKIINVLLIYWVTWHYSAEVVNFLQFLVILAPPAIIYLQCDALLAKNPDGVQDWRAHYYANHRYFFAANFALGLTLLAQIYWASGPDYPPPAPFLLMLLCIASLLGAIFKNHRLHAVLAVLAFANITAGFVGQLAMTGP